MSYLATIASGTASLTGAIFIGGFTGAVANRYCEHLTVPHPKNEEVEKIGALIGAISQATFIILNALAYKNPLATATMGLSLLAATYFATKEIRDSADDARRVFYVVLASTLATAALLILGSAVPTGMHFRTFGIIS